MSKTKQPSGLDAFIPRPEIVTAKRHMIAISPESYEFITDTANEFKTSRGKVVAALIASFNEANQK